MIFLSIGSMILCAGFLATTVLREQILTTYLVLFHLCRRPEKWANQPGQSYYIQLGSYPFPQRTEHSIYSILECCSFGGVLHTLLPWDDRSATAGSAGVVFMDEVHQYAGFTETLLDQC